MHILRIADFNPTGLVVGEKDDRSSDWFKVTKAVGVSDKNAGKLGSFGIGKHAPSQCSDLSRNLPLVYFLAGYGE